MELGRWRKWCESSRVGEVEIGKEEEIWVCVTYRLRLVFPFSSSIPSTTAVQPRTLRFFASAYICFFKSAIKLIRQKLLS